MTSDWKRAEALANLLDAQLRARETELAHAREELRSIAHQRSELLCTLERVVSPFARSAALARIGSLDQRAQAARDNVDLTTARVLRARLRGERQAGKARELSAKLSNDREQKEILEWLDLSAFPVRDDPV